MHNDKRPGTAYAYLAFLRYCLNSGLEVPEEVAHINWQDLLEFAKKQAIVGVFGNRLLSDNAALMDDETFRQNSPTEEEVMDWMGVMTLIKNRNVDTNELCAKTVSKFHEEGFETCILKGQGNNLFYPDVYMRTSGDIDLWTVPSESRRITERKKRGWLSRLALSDRMITFAYVRHLFPNAKFKCQHIEFNVWKTVPVEVHFFPMYLENFFSNRQLKRFFREQRDQQFANTVLLPDTKIKVSVPTPFFNAIYQLTHINVHVLIEGIGLRQLIDYYYVLRLVPKERHAEIRKLLRSIHLTKLAAAVMWIQKEVFGLEEQYLYIEPDERRGQKLLKEIEMGGNFGFYDPRKPQNEGFWHLQFRKILQHSSFIIDYPSEELSEPFFRFFHYCWRVWYQLKWKLLFR